MKKQIKKIDKKQFKSKKEQLLIKHGHQIVSLLIFTVFLLSYIYGYNNKNVIIDAKFDELTYRMDDEGYDGRFHGVLNIDKKDEIDYGFYSSFQSQTFRNYRSEEINSFVSSAIGDEQKPFILTFNGFDNFSYKTNGISTSFYSDSNHKMEMINLELYLEESTKVESSLFYLPSSIADLLIELDNTGTYNNYDNLVEKLEVNVLTNTNDQSVIEKSIKIRNIFFDEADNPLYEGKDDGFGSSFRGFLGPYFVSNSKKMQDSINENVQIGFTTKSSFFSLKNYLKKMLYNNEDIVDASVKVYGIKNDGKHLIFDEASINELFNPGNVNQTLGIVALLFAILLFISAILLTILTIDISVEEGLFLVDKKDDKKNILNYSLSVLIPFLGVHLIYSVFFNHVHKLWLIRAYNIIGNAATIIISTLYFAVVGIYYMQKHKKLEKDHIHE